MIIDKTAPRVSRGTLARTLFAGVAAATLASMFGTSAMAEDAHVKEMKFQVLSPYKMATVTISSSDGKKWDTIQPGDVSFHGIMRVDTRYPGYVERAGVFLGKCSNSACGNHQRVWADWIEQRDYNESRMFTFPVEKLKNAHESVFGISYGEVMLAKCNEGLSADGATTPHTKLISPTASFTVNTRKGTPAPVEVQPEGTEIPFNGGDHTRHGAFLVQLECVATSKAQEPPPRDPHRTKVSVQDIDLFLTTYQAPQTGPRGTTCKPLKVTTRIGTDKEGPVNVKLWRQVNGGPITSESKQMHAEALGGDKFGDDWNKVEQFTKTTTIQFKAEILGGTFTPSTPWKSITIHCNGDFAAPTNDNTPELPPRGKPQVELPPVIVTPPPTVTPPPCGTKAAKVRGAAPCIKTAPLPDPRQQWADQKRKQAAEEKRRQAEQRRRAAASRNADMRRQQMMHRSVIQRPVMQRPFGFGRPMGPMRGQFGMGIMLRR